MDRGDWLSLIGSQHCQYRSLFRRWLHSTAYCSSHVFTKNEFRIFFKVSNQKQRVIINKYSKEPRVLRNYWGIRKLRPDLSHFLKIQILVVIFYRLPPNFIILSAYLRKYITNEILIVPSKRHLAKTSSNQFSTAYL